MPWETDLANSLNRHFTENDISSLAYRFPKASKFSVQPCDILVDSLDRKYYQAIECKSMRIKNKKVLYFSERFSDKSKKYRHQIDRMHDFCTITGRAGYLAVELISKQKEAFILPFDIVFELFSDLKPGVPLTTIREGVPVPRSHGQYNFD